MNDQNQFNADIIINIEWRCLICREKWVWSGDSPFEGLVYMELENWLREP